MMNKRTSIIATFCLIICLVSIISYSVDAANIGIKSRGQVLYDADGDGSYQGEGDIYLAATDLERLDQRINTLSGEVQNISGSIESNKENIINIINTYPGQVVSPDTSFTEIATYINELTNFPSDTYFYVDGTEGDATIERYKKINDQYYPCDENGNVQEGASSVDVTSKTLIDYTAMAAADLSAGAGGYVNKSLILGDGSDNAAYYAQGYTNGAEESTLKCVWVGSGSLKEDKTFDVKMYEGYQTFTINNFGLHITSVDCVEQSGNSVNNGNSYNPKTGIVTIGAVHHASFIANGHIRGYANYNLYLYY